MSTSSEIVGKEGKSGRPVQSTFICNNSFNHQNKLIIYVSLFVVLYKWEKMLKVTIEFAQVHTATKWQSWGLNSVSGTWVGALNHHTLFTFPTQSNSFLSPSVVSTIFTTWKALNNLSMDWEGRGDALCLLAYGLGAGLSNLYSIDVGGCLCPGGGLAACLASTH